MAFHHPQRIATQVVETGAKKAMIPTVNVLGLGFLGGAFISLSFLLYILVVGNLPSEWGSFNSLLGGAVFSLGVVLVVIARGELLTGNIVALTMALLAKRATLSLLSKNWLLVIVGNFVGAIFIAYFFSLVIGLTEAGVFLSATIATAQEKVDYSFSQTLLLGIGCSLLICFAIWLAFGADNISGKALAIWFPIMAFVTIGFQNVIVNMFVIPAAIFAGHLSWGDFISNIIPVFIGNAIGGGLFAVFMYRLVYRRQLRLVQPPMNRVKNRAM